MDTLKKPARAAETAPATTPAPSPAPRQPLPEPAGGWPRDEYTGLAGRYVRDPFTGKRRPAGDTAAAADATTPADGQ